VTKNICQNAHRCPLDSCDHHELHDEDDTTSCNVNCRVERGVIGSCCITTIQYVKQLSTAKLIKLCLLSHHDARLLKVMREEILRRSE